MDFYLIASSRPFAHGQITWLKSLLLHFVEPDPSGSLNISFSSISQDERIIDAPRQRKQTKRYGRGDDVDFELSDLDSDEEVPQAKRRAWTRVECFKVEKNLLIYG